MGKHFISVLGTGGYTSCKYGFEGKEWETLFVQEAVLKTAVGEMGEEDRITIFLTDKAKAFNWEDRTYTPFELEKNKELNPEEIRGGLKNILLHTYGAEKVKEVEIPTGKTEEELDEIFETIYEEIQEGEEVYFDITHGLRNIPMQALTILNYARVLKKIKIAGIYYGAYEVKDQETGVAPIFNLSRYNEILEWTSAAEAFVNAGDGKQIKTLYDRKKKDLQEKKKGMLENDTGADKDEQVSWEHQEKLDKMKQEQKDLKNLEPVINGIVNLTSCLETGRGKNFPEDKKNSRKSIYGAYADLKKSFDGINETQKGMIKPLKPLFGEIEKSVKIFDTDGQNGLTGIAAVQWAIDNHLLQQGYTALEETMKTVICELNGLSGKDERERDWITGSAIKTISAKIRDLKQEERKAKKEGKIINAVLNREEAVTYWEQNYKNNKLDEHEVEIAKKILREIPEEYAVLMNNVTNSRNSINHFGFQETTEEYTKLEANLDKYYSEFKELYETLKATIK